MTLDVLAETSVIKRHKPTKPNFLHEPKLQRGILVPGLLNYCSVPITITITITSYI